MHAAPLPAARRTEGGFLMTGTFFQVDLDALGQVISSLNQAEELMGEALAAMKADGGNFFSNLEGGTLGTGQLDSACGDFQSKWSYGLGQLQNDIKSVVQGVQQNQQAYQQVEQDVTKAMDQLKGSL
jgi:hypothetical protein